MLKDKDGNYIGVYRVKSGKLINQIVITYGYPKTYGCPEYYQKGDSPENYYYFNVLVHNNGTFYTPENCIYLHSNQLELVYTSVEEMEKSIGKL